MGDKKTKTKAAMLDELESIKGLLLEEDDIPILQEVIENKVTLPIENSASKSPATQMIETKTEVKPTADAKTIFEEQQDFFHSPVSTQTAKPASSDRARELMDTLGELEKHTADVTANKFSSDINKSSSRTSLAKATGENPFLPEHIRARLYGNNPPPLFETETARKISTTSVPSRQLGNTFSVTGTNVNVGTEKTNHHRQDIIDSIIEKMMPDIEKELRNRLEIMTKNLLDELNK